MGLFYFVFLNYLYGTEFRRQAGQAEGFAGSGFKFVNNLKERLSHLDNHFRIILCLDPDSDEVTIRFFVKRSDVRYGSDDPDDYTLEEVAFWDI